MFFPAYLVSNAALLDQKETHKGKAWRGLSKTLGYHSVAGLMDKDVHPSAASLLSGVCSGSGLVLGSTVKPTPPSGLSTVCTGLQRRTGHTA